MKPRRWAMAVLFLILAPSCCVDLFPGVSYSAQHRDLTNAAPSLHFPLGTDDLGRDRLARLIYATRTSLLLAAAAALGTMLVAISAGAAAGYFGGWRDRFVVGLVDLMLSVPWLFLLLAARALLPLNASPESSLVITYALLALLGWAAPARVVRARVRSVRDSGFVLQARAVGCAEGRILLRYILPNLKPILLAQFWTSIPVFVLAEANLGFLGLSAAEPFPTWGTLLRDLQNPLALRPEGFVPVIVVALTVSCLQLAVPCGGTQA